jgi:hypothetical protein
MVKWCNWDFLWSLSAPSAIPFPSPAFTHVSGEFLGRQGLTTQGERCGGGGGSLIAIFKGACLVWGNSLCSNFLKLRTYFCSNCLTVTNSLQVCSSVTIQKWGSKRHALGGRHVLCA